MKFTKRLVALMLSLVMVLGAVPTFVTESNALSDNGIYVDASEFSDSVSSTDFTIIGFSVANDRTYWLTSLDNGVIIDDIQRGNNRLAIYENNILQTEDFSFDESNTYKFVLTAQFGELKTELEHTPIESIPQDLEVFFIGTEDWEVDADYNVSGTTLTVTIELSPLPEPKLEFEYGPIYKGTFEELIDQESIERVVSMKDKSTIGGYTLDDINIEKIGDTDQYFVVFGLYFDDPILEGPEQLMTDGMPFIINGKDVTNKIVYDGLENDLEVYQAVLDNKTVIWGDIDGYDYIVRDLIDAKVKSHTKKYKANDSDTAEKVSGSGKKNSTRTITPIEGKKVLNVTVLDKKGNTIEVTPNEDGTFEFIQPASDVTINVEYAKREVALNINSNEVVIDGISSTNDVKPIVKNGTTLLPLRIVAEGLGYQVNWNAFDPNVIELYRSNEETYNLYLNQYYDEYANQMTNYENFLTVENNRTFVEENALGKLLGATISTSSENPNQIIVTEE